MRKYGNPFNIKTEKMNLKTRPVIHTLEINASMSDAELFQNETLRPIIKMQHDLLIAVFNHLLISKKCDFDHLSEKQQLAFIESSFKKDMPFRNKVKGMIIGHFNADEYQSYILNEKEVDKRIIKIVEKRIVDELI